jgi:type I restriction enzyme, S subunit
MKRCWPRHNLGDVADLCLGKMLDKNKNKGELHPYLGNIHVRWGTFDLEELPQMRFENHEHERYGLQNGDLVVCEGGEPGRCALWKNQVPNMKIQKALHRVRPHKCLDSQYLLYWFLEAGQRNYFDQFCTGATIKHMPGEKLAKIEVDVPPLVVQQRIAGILSAYDDLIENCQRRIKVLEEMARALYREWLGLP